MNSIYASETARTLRLTMARRKRQSESLGDRIKRLRLGKGMTQTELGDLVGESQRVIAYYETEGGTPDPELILKFADALEVTTDELLGRTTSRARSTAARPNHLRLLRHAKKLDELQPQDRKTVLRMIDAFASRMRGRNAE